MLPGYKIIFPGRGRFIHRKMVGADIAMVLENDALECRQGRTSCVWMIGDLRVGNLVEVVVPAMYRRGHKRIQHQ